MKDFLPLRDGCCYGKKMYWRCEVEDLTEYGDDRVSRFPEAEEAEIPHLFLVDIGRGRITNMPRIQRVEESLTCLPCVIAGHWVPGTDILGLLIFSRS